jgi:hypothetical protein
VLGNFFCQGRCEIPPSPSKHRRKQKDDDKRITSFAANKDNGTERRQHENNRAFGLVGVGSRFGVWLPLDASPPRLFEKLRSKLNPDVAPVFVMKPGATSIYPAYHIA